MNILYLVYFDVNDSDQIGVNNKIKNQVDAFRKLGHSVFLASCIDNKFCIEEVNGKKEYDIKYGLTHYRKSVFKVLKDGLYKKIDMVYLRYPGSIDYTLFNTFKFLKKNGVGVVLEMPTYPIGGELATFLHELWTNKRYASFIMHSAAYGMHRIFSRSMYGYVDKIVTFMPYDDIWGIKTVRIDNGVDTDKCKTVEKKVRRDNKIILILVARLSIWHGADRMIRGISEYYKNKGYDDIELRIVGDSALCDELKELTNELNMTSHVKFLGAKYDNELYQEYCNADIAVGSLGMHRIKVLNGSTLKIKEYCSYGLPFILGYKERMIDSSFKYALSVKATDDPVDMQSVLDFYKKLKMDASDIRAMHDFAVKHYTWLAQMKEVIASL